MSRRHAALGNRLRDIFLGPANGSAQRQPPSQVAGDGGRIHAAGAVSADTPHERSAQKQLLPAVIENIDRLAQAAQVPALDQHGAAETLVQRARRVPQLLAAN